MHHSLDCFSLSLSFLQRDGVPVSKLVAPLLSDRFHSIVKFESVDSVGIDEITGCLISYGKLECRAQKVERSSEKFLSAKDCLTNIFYRVS